MRKKKKLTTIRLAVTPAEDPVVSALSGLSGKLHSQGEKEGSKTGNLRIKSANALSVFTGEKSPAGIAVRLASF